MIDFPPIDIQSKQSTVHVLPVTCGKRRAPISFFQLVSPGRSPQRFLQPYSFIEGYHMQLVHHPRARLRQLGNSLLRFLLVEAAQVTVRINFDWRHQFLHLRYDGNAGSLKSRWPASSRSDCTGCGARDGTTSSSKSSVRTWDGPEIARVYGNHR